MTPEQINQFLDSYSDGVLSLYQKDGDYWHKRGEIPLNDMKKMIRNIRELVEEQKRTITALMTGVEEATGKQGSTAIITYIARLEEQVAAMEQRS